MRPPIVYIAGVRARLLIPYARCALSTGNKHDWSPLLLARRVRSREVDVVDGNRRARGEPLMLRACCILELGVVGGGSAHRDFDAWLRMIGAQSSFSTQNPPYDNARCGKQQ